MKYIVVTAEHGGVGELLIVRNINNTLYWTWISIGELKTLLNIGA